MNRVINRRQFSKSNGLAKRLQAGDKIIGDAKVKPLRVGHFQREVTFSLPQDFLGAGELEFTVIAEIGFDHFVQDVVDRRREQMHAEPAEEFIGCPDPSTRSFLARGLQPPASR